MMQVQMPKFVKISQDFICIYKKITGGRGSAGVQQGPGKWSWEVLEIFVTNRVGTLCICTL